MAAFDFPIPTALGQKFTPPNGPTYSWDGYAWVIPFVSGGGSGNASVAVGAEPPTAATQGMFWFNTNNGQLYTYYEDGNSNQWVSVSGANGGSEPAPEPTPAVGPGFVAYYAAQTAPTGWLKANGALVSRFIYPELFTAIGTTFGAGDGNMTFQLPDLRGEFVRTWDDARGVDASRAFGSAQGDAFQGHFHAQSYRYYTWVNLGGGVLGGGGQSSTQDTAPREPTDGGWGAPKIANETRPKNIALLAVIKY
jgi:phage-related tail fiber protein